MELNPMYPAANSRYTQLAQDITEGQDVLPVADVSVFPPGPNYAAVETWDDQEVVLYQDIDEETGTLTGCLRGRSDTVAKAWLAGADVLHVIASANLNAVMDNLRLLAEDSGGSEELQAQIDSLKEDKADKADVQEALEGKADRDDVQVALADKADKAETQAALDDKADTSALTAVKATADAAMPGSGGTFTGQVAGANSTAGTAQFRNIQIVTSEPTSFTPGVITALVEG